MASNNTTIGDEKVQRRHVICLPSPAQSHIGAMLKLAKLLHHRGFYISFVNSEFNHRLLLEARGPGFVDDPPRGFQFLAITDGLPLNAPQSVADMCYAAKQGMAGPFDDLIGDLNRKAAAAGDGYEFPSVSCIILDGFMNFSTTPAATKYELPIVYLWTISACALMCFKQFGALMERRLVPLKQAEEVDVTNGYMDMVIDWIPGMKNIRFRDLPSFVRTTDPNDFLFNFVKDTTERANKATATVIHTFEALEQHVVDALSSIVVSGPVYTIGPLHGLLENIPHHLKDINSNLLKENTECLEWLDTQKENSVLYINFGSIEQLAHQQLVELAMGITESKQPFMWTVKPADLVSMPLEFTQRTKGRGLVSGWCPQEQVLNHPCIGAFLTHCGWNSVIESLSAGVPMLCYPFSADQQTNCRYTCVEWLAGIEIPCPITRGVVALLVTDLLIGQNRIQLKMNAIKWKKLTNQATNSPYGSSFINLDKLVDHILS